jgi:hypothetical protein
MRLKAFSRWQAAGTHLLISATLAAVALVVILGVWYPGPLFEAAGGLGLLYLLVGVDVVLGPLLTLIVFKSGKRGMKLDLAVIGVVQFAALVYGCSVVALARPAFVVFVKDRFEMVTPAELAPAELAAAKYPQFRAPPWTGPLFVFADMPTDPAEHTKVVMAALSGLDLQNFPRYFVPYGDRVREVLGHADTVVHLREVEPVTARAVDAYLAGAGLSPNDVLCLMLRTRFAWIAVLVDPKTAQPLKLVLGEEIK